MKRHLARRWPLPGRGVTCERHEIIANGPLVNQTQVLLLFVKHRVVDSLALTVCSSIGGDSRPSVGRDHDAPRGSGLAAFLLHDLVGAGVNLRKRDRIAIRVVTLHWVIPTVKLAADFPVLSLALDGHCVDREFYAVLEGFPLGHVALRCGSGTIFGLG